MTYAAFIRAINVGAHNRIRMAELRTLVEELGYDAVRTYLHTGNVAFDAGRRRPATVAGTLEQTLAASGLDVDVMVRRRDELDALVGAAPLDGYDPEAYYRYALFTRAPVDPPAEPLEIRGVLFLPSPPGALVAVSSKHEDRPANATAVVESHWKVRATARWWNVVEEFTQGVLRSAS